VYRNHAERYELLVSRQPSLVDAIQAIKPIQGLDVIDMGAGSGRLTTILAPAAKSILALDASPKMLEINERKLKELGITNFNIKVADHRHIPVQNESCDLVVSGWSISYLASSNVSNFEDNIEKIMQEMNRVLRPDGTIIIFETVGTGYEIPTPPDYLRQYYTLLEDTYGFTYKWMRLDYQFRDVKEAEELTRFFFGDEVADKVVNENLSYLPECAGMWWLNKN